MACSAELAVIVYFTLISQTGNTRQHNEAHTNSLKERKSVVQHFRLVSALAHMRHNGATI